MRRLLAFVDRLWCHVTGHELCDLDSARGVWSCRCGDAEESFVAQLVRVSRS